MRSNYWTLGVKQYSASFLYSPFSWTFIKLSEESNGQWKCKYLNNFYDAFLNLLKEQDMIIGQLAVSQNVLLI